MVSCKEHDMQLSFNYTGKMTPLVSFQWLKHIQTCLVTENVLILSKKKQKQKTKKSGLALWPLRMTNI